MKNFVLYIIALLTCPPAYSIEGNYGVSSGDNLMQLSVSGTLNDNRICTVNSDNKINVEWKDLITMNMTGDNYKQNIIGSFECNAETKVTIKISGSEATFGSGLLLTNSSNVAIQFYSGDTKIAVNKGVSYTWSSSAQPPQISVSPVANNQQLNQQDAFAANASLVISFE
ncbi:fimbrial protein [Enterobacter sp. CC120223-11]|uniref:fimbrial protein n=1 Tax=Enterobacter sp. CC120223-11 TaxID=1378073 RepID=UPI000BDC4528|nr:fimbrial protein [Enterobacter sp. CC120223-11]SNY69826.1 Fimbrial protein [Enterobacter sp. CC120223-11]